MTGCTGSHELDVDVGRLDLDAAQIEDAVATVDASGPTDALYVDANLPPPPVVCGGHACGAGEVCCVSTLRCVAPGDPRCAVPPGSPAGACASNADCPSDQSCQVVDARGNALAARCGGLGTCWTPTISCGGGGPGVCGCDGHTYPDVCMAHAARVRIVALTPCGTAANQENQGCGTDADCHHGLCNTTDPTDQVCLFDDPLIVCGTDAQCPAGQICCALNGFCFGPDHAEVCTTPPAGTDFSCNTDADCQRYDGSWWRADILNSYFCDGATCNGPGGCRVPRGCDGTLAPTCGCDGHTYQNACEVNASRVRIAHAGGC